MPRCASCTSGGWPNASSASSRGCSRRPSRAWSARPSGLRRADRAAEPLRDTRWAERHRVDAGVLGVAVSEQFVSPDDLVLVAETGSARADAAGVDDELVVETGRDPVADERLEDERFDALLAQRLVTAGELAEVLDARDLEPDHVRRVVRD